MIDFKSLCRRFNWCRINPCIATMNTFILSVAQSKSVYSEAMIRVLQTCSKMPSATTSSTFIQIAYSIGTTHPCKDETLYGFAWVKQKIISKVIATKPCVVGWVVSAQLDKESNRHSCKWFFILCMHTQNFWMCPKAQLCWPSGLGFMLNQYCNYIKKKWILQ